VGELVLRIVFEGVSVVNECGVVVASDMGFETKVKLGTLGGRRLSLSGACCQDHSPQRSER
jgi:hypothetical protein